MQNSSTMMIKWLITWYIYIAMCFQFVMVIYSICDNKHDIKVFTITISLNGLRQILVIWWKDGPEIISFHFTYGFIITILQQFILLWHSCFYLCVCLLVCVHLCFFMCVYLFLVSLHCWNLEMVCIHCVKSLFWGLPCRHFNRVSL